MANNPRPGKSQLPPAPSFIPYAAAPRTRATAAESGSLAILCPTSTLATAFRGCAFLRAREGVRSLAILSRSASCRRDRASPLRPPFFGEWGFGSPATVPLRASWRPDRASPLRPPFSGERGFGSPATVPLRASWPRQSVAASPSVFGGEGVRIANTRPAESTPLAPVHPPQNQKVSRGWMT
jgi:hypothetical protein